MDHSAKGDAAINFSVSIVVNTTHDAVAEALMNPKNIPCWQTDLESFEVIGRKPGELGSRGRLHYSQKGKKYVLEDRMVSCEPGRSCVSQVTGDALEARVETILASYGDKTEMTINRSGGARYCC